MAFTFFDDCEANCKIYSETIIEFLSSNPEFFGWRGKSVPDLSSDDGKNKVREKMVSSFSKFNLPSLPKTSDDPALAKILKTHYAIDDVARAIIEHRSAMAAENFVGYLLEMYIFSIAWPIGWCLCPDAIVRSVDFVKKENGKWIMLQIKNRDNSENSSSKKVRDGTEIRHWFRTFSQKPGSNWQNFPDPELRDRLSEEGFLNFIDNYFDGYKNT